MTVLCEAAELPQFYVYMVAGGRNGTLYVGVTNDLSRRTYEHRNGLGSGFSTKYGCKRLVWFETHSDIREAITREKRLKKWNRSWKVSLIEKANPEWADLFDAIAA